MNIFIFNLDNKVNVQQYCDRHVVKMLIEYAQLLSNAHHYVGSTDLAPYRLTHKNHPCSIFVRNSLSNWLWLRELTLDLYEEYKHRYNKIHKSGEVVRNMSTPKLYDIGLTQFPQCLPDKYKNKNVCEAYKNYFNGEKLHLAQYKNRDVPSWIKM